LIPSIIFMSNPIRPETWMMSIPMFSQNLLIGEIIRGDAVPLVWYALSICSTLVIGLALAAITANLYNKPRLIFTGS
jgi:sodium transport system permease protein